MKRYPLAISTGLALLVALPASAQFQKPEDAIKYRKAVMTLQNNHMGRLGAMAQGRIPFDAKVAADNAEVVAMLSRLPFAAFVEGSDKGDTRAKADVWSHADKFKGAAARFQDTTAALTAAAKSGNFDPFKAAVGETGKACKACHDDFRKD